MAEDVKKESIVHPAVRPFDNTKAIIAKTGAFKGAVNRYEIIWDVPLTDEEAMKRYNCNLSRIVELGIQIFSHAPDYASLFDGKEDEYSRILHENLQSLADKQKAGMRTPGKSARLKAEAEVGRKAIASASALGFDNVEDALAFAAKLQKKAGKKNIK